MEDQSPPGLPSPFCVACSDILFRSLTYSFFVEHVLGSFSFLLASTPFPLPSLLISPKFLPL